MNGDNKRDLEGDLREAFNNRMDRMEERIDSAIADLQKSITENAKTPWGDIFKSMVVVTILVSLGGAAAIAPWAERIKILEKLLDDERAALAKIGHDAEREAGRREVIEQFGEFPPHRKAGQ